MAKTKFPGPNTYDGFDAYLGRKNRRPLSHNVYVVRDGVDIVVVYHWTNILTFRPDGTVMLNSGGFRTVTTKGNINQYSDCYVYQEKHVWYFSYGDADKKEFEDGMEYAGEPAGSALLV